ncbi:hypothetical protein [Natronoarchaeum rubrum]|uniref:hypothetical protein n=1 Tax=Natronoarchaeum rubrum TaxID=755311 RepID=UPI0021123E4C|nr:hypothetical protein [Natronoarchaeum rubrum]
MSKPTKSRSTTLTNWNDLPSDTRRRLLKAIAVTQGTDEFTRRDLEESIDETDLSQVVDDQSEIVVRTKMLNKLVEEDGYLTKTHQSDGVPFVLYVGDHADPDDPLTGLTPSELSRMVREVLKKEGRGNASVDHIDFRYMGEVCTKVNMMLSDTVLIIVSDPNEYRLRKSALSEIRNHI